MYFGSIKTLLVPVINCAAASACHQTLMKLIDEESSYVNDARYTLSMTSLYCYEKTFFDKIFKRVVRAI
jgi:hypothetical protein